MRFIYGFIFALVVLTVGAAIHDNLASKAEKPLVNWKNVSEETQATFEYAKEQFDHLTKSAGPENLDELHVGVSVRKIAQRFRRGDVVIVF